jgi:hypothetical protein
MGQRKVKVKCHIQLGYITLLEILQNAKYYNYGVFKPH